MAQGYTVESKRGGGGYIRIQKVNLNKHQDILEGLAQVVGKKLTQNDGIAILQQLYNYDIISKREGNLLFTMMSNDVLQMDKLNEEKIRARMFQMLLERLSYEDKE